MTRGLIPSPPGDVVFFEIPADILSDRLIEIIDSLLKDKRICILFECHLKSSLMVTDGDFGAREVIPRDGEVFDFDWDIKDYRNDDFFAVFDNNDVLQMIQTLTSGIRIKLEAWFDTNEN